MKTKRIDKQKNILGYLIIIAVELFFSSNYFFNTFPQSEGWFVNYIELIMAGKMPYRDFYYYLPPLNLLIDYAFWKLSFGFLIIFRVWYLIERTSIYIFVYKILNMRYDWIRSSIACSISAILCTCDVFDLFGDYNQHIVVLTVALVYFAIRFSQTNSESKKYQMLAIAGGIMGLMFLTKQTIFVSANIIYFIIFTVLCIKEKNRNYFKYILFIAVGEIIPIAIAFLYFIDNNSLFNFIDQVFVSVDGKGTIFDIVLFSPIQVLKNWDCWIIALIVVFNLSFEKLNNKKINFLFGTVMILYVLEKVGLETEICFFRTYYLFIKFVIIIWALIFAYKKKYGISKYFLIFFEIIVVALFLIITTYNYNTYMSVYNMNLFGLIESAVMVIAFYSMIIVICLELRKTNVDQYKVMYISGGIALVYAASMVAGSTSIPALAMRILFPLLMVSILNVKINTNKYFIKSIFCIICLGSIAIAIAQKSVCAYPWWGMTEYVKIDKIYSTKEKALKGFYFSKDEQEMYDNISQIIIHNSEPDDIVFGWPYLKIYNILCERYESYFVPVLWYDVVGDKYVEQAFAEIEDAPPKIVVWKEIPNAIETHENIYRKGKPLVQRRIIEYFETAFENGKYELLGEYNEIKVYKLKKNTVVQ